MILMSPLSTGGWFFLIIGCYNYNMKFIKRQRKGKLHAPLPCTKCPKIIEVGEYYWDGGRLHTHCKNCGGNRKELNTETKKELSVIEKKDREISALKYMIGILQKEELTAKVDLQNVSFQLDLQLDLVKRLCRELRKTKGHFGSLDI